MLETILLKEYEDQTVDLSEADSEFISRDLAGKIDIRRDIRGQHFILNPAQFVGVMALPSGRQLESRPKISVSNLFYMLAIRLVDYFRAVIPLTIPRGTSNRWPRRSFYVQSPSHPSDMA